MSEDNQKDGDKTPENENGNEETPEEKEKEKLKGENSSDTTDKSKDDKSKISKDDKGGDDKNLQSAIAQKEHQREKREIAETKVKELEKKLADKKPGESDDEWKDRVDFLLTNSDKEYSKEELTHIKTVATRDQISLQEASEQEDVSDYIQFRRDKVAKAKGTPGPSNLGGGEQGPTEKETRKMNSEEWKTYIEKEEAKSLKGITGA